MEAWQLLGGVAVVAIFFWLLGNLISGFRTKLRSFLIVFAIPLLFAAGFGFRLSGEQQLIDFGFFLTEASYLFTYLLFTAVLLLGQKKYWKVS